MRKFVCSCRHGAKPLPPSRVSPWCLSWQRIPVPARMYGWPPLQKKGSLIGRSLAHRPAVTPEELNAASSLCPPPPRFYTHLYSFNALSAWMDFFNATLCENMSDTYVLRLRGASLLSEGCWCFWTPPPNLCRPPSLVKLKLCNGVFVLVTVGISGMLWEKCQSLWMVMLKKEKLKKREKKDRLSHLFHSLRKSAE